MKRSLIITSALVLGMLVMPFTPQVDAPSMQIAHADGGPTSPPEVASTPPSGDSSDESVWEALLSELVDLLS